MNRDMDVVREIVLGLNAATDSFDHLDGIDDDVFKYNAQLVIEAGLARGIVSDSIIDAGGVPGAVYLERLTWEGHDFADSIADDTLWKKAKEKVIKPSASWTFAILRDYLKFEIKQRLGIDVP